MVLVIIAMTVVVILVIININNNTSNNTTKKTTLIMLRIIRIITVIAVGLQKMTSCRRCLHLRGASRFSNGCPHSVPCPLRVWGEDCSNKSVNPGQQPQTQSARTRRPKGSPTAKPPETLNPKSGQAALGRRRRQEGGQPNKRRTDWALRGFEV